MRGTAFRSFVMTALVVDAADAALKGGIRLREEANS
jgi:hypothetical protein